MLFIGRTETKDRMDEKEAGLRFVTKRNTLQEYTIAGAENLTGKAA
jgi:hypothetical protein